MTINRFETGTAIADLSRTRLRAAFEAKRIRFVDEGAFKGAVVGPTRAGN